jgi:hypothetical protein
MVKSCPKELRKTGKADEQTGAKDGEELPKRNRGRRKQPREITGKNKQDQLLEFFL